MIKKLIVFLLIFAPSLITFSKNSDLQAVAEKINAEPKIDGKLDDLVWQNAVPISNFTQFEPFIGKSPKFQTKVYILYNDEAIYFGAKMYDTSPDSILNQLGDRDDDLNADHLTIQFDPFNNNQDAYYFRLTSSGVQSDWRKRDGSFNAVWHSRVAILEDGWSLEIKIPFSSIRIPNLNEHTWAFQVTRNIRRTREFSKWAPEAKGVENDMIFWGKLKGINNIKPPLRLSVTPYFSTFAQLEYDKTNDTRSFFITPNGGLDLKLGLTNSFTLDLTLLPDFSQVRSDDVVKNLSAFEIEFSEQRPFFLESMDLFDLGNIFYSRRIGKTPSFYGNVREQVLENEEIIFNPRTTNLINSLKITGQTSGGLSIGFLNAVTDKAEAEIRQADGTIRKIETEPLANYNVSVMRQALKNNSWIYLINTNLLRQGENLNANTTATGGRFFDKSNTYSLFFNTAVSNRFYNTKDISLPEMGYFWNTGVAKVRGQFQSSLSHQIRNDKYNINEMGINHTNDESITNFNVTYRIFEPFWQLLRFNISTGITYGTRISTNKPINNNLFLSFGTTTKKHLSIWGSFSQSLDNVYDYYEPRVNSNFYLVPKSTSGRINFSSDYRRPFALDGFLGFTRRKEIDNTSFSAELNPIIRVNDNLLVNFSSMTSRNFDAIGFAGKTDDNIPIFGQRNVNVIENTFAGKYIFINNLSLSIRVRHYLSTGKYKNFYLLNTDGTLGSASNNIEIDDFNFNYFNIDLVFNWEFAPGSNLTFVWKNNIEDQNSKIIRSYFENVNSIFDQSELNMFSLKIIYFLDYHTLKSRIRRS